MSYLADTNPDLALGKVYLPTGGTTMAKPLLDDKLWKVIEPLLPPPKPRRFRFPGRKPLDNRNALTGIIFVLKTGISWEFPRRWAVARG